MCAFDVTASADDVQKKVSVPTCLDGVWDGPKRFGILPALREANVTVDEFDSHWAKRTSALATQSDKMQLVVLLKQAGVRGGNGGDMKARRRRKVWFVQEIVGRVTGAPPPAPTSRRAMSPNTTKRVCVCSYMCMHVS